MSRQSPSVLLIAGIDTVGIGRLPCLMSDAGYRVHLLGPDRLTACRSKFVTERIPCQPGPDSAARTARDHLASARQRYERIILADEPTLWAALDTAPKQEESPEWLRDWFPVPLNPSSLELLRSKTVFLRECRAAGVPTPTFEICDNDSEILRVAESLGFPVFIKATRGWSGSGLRFARTRGELEAQFGNGPAEGPFLVQREVSGESGSVSVLYDHGIPICWFAYLMIRTWPNRFSAASAIRLFPHPLALPLVESIGRLTQFTGLAGIDFVWEQRADRLACLEFNPRPTPVYHLGHRARVDFAQALMDMERGSSVRQFPGQSEAEIELYPQTLYDSLEHFQPIRFFRAWRDAPWREPGLTAAYFRRFLTHYIPDVVKQKMKG